MLALSSKKKGNLYRTLLGLAAMVAYSVGIFLAKKEGDEMNLFLAIAMLVIIAAYTVNSFVKYRKAS
jgi:uncharacterized membrane protein YiaA